MSEMSFIPELRAYLKDNKFIYTVRKYNMADAFVEVTDVGACHRIPMRVVMDKHELESYWEHSGFKSLDLWWAKIRQFIPNLNDPMYLYKVEVLNE